MSIKVMTMVFDRYPNGGGEMLLALALADHASDDGSRIYPSIKHLATKTRQSERAVQYQLRKMEAAMWLLLENSGNGGRNQHRMYCINPAWINGAEIAPIEKGANDDIKGAICDTKGANDDSKGCKAFAPAYNHQEPSDKPSENRQAVALAVPAIADTSDPVAFEFPLNDGTTYGLRQSQIDQFASLYPAVDVITNIRSCMAWSITNPTRRKTRSGILRHINSWLADKQNKPAPQQIQQSPYQQKLSQQQALINRISGGSNAPRAFKDIN